MKVIKRDGQKVDFDASKIENAILKAMKCGSGIVDTKCAHDNGMSLMEIIFQFIVLKDKFLKS